MKEDHSGDSSRIAREQSENCQSRMKMSRCFEVKFDFELEQAEALVVELV